MLIASIVGNRTLSIRESLEMRKRWDNYVRQMTYAKGIAFSDTIDAMIRVIADMSIIPYQGKEDEGTGPEE